MRNTFIACLLLLNMSDGYAQLTKPCYGSGCSSNVDNTDSYNVAKTEYDHNFPYGSKAWQDDDWHLFYKISAGSNLDERMDSPFFMGNGNTENIAADGNSDFNPQDGWELVFINLGGEEGGAVQYVANPTIILYNKYKSVLRVMLYVTQLFSETGGKDAASVRLAFSGGFQSAALAHHETATKALDNFKKNVVLSGVNDFPSNSNQWLTADFPIAYDPCTCQNTQDLRLKVDAVLYNKGIVDIRIDPIPGTPETKEDKSSNVLSAVAASFTDSGGGALAGAIKSYEKADKAVDEMEKWAEQLFPDTSLKIKVSDELQEIGEGVGAFSKFLSQVGPFSSAAMGLFDFFINGGSSTGKSFQPVAIVNSMKASGSITFSSIKNLNTFDVPGAMRGSTVNEYAIYNNTMGIMNLVETPEVEETFVRTSGSGQAVWTYAVHHRLTNPIKYAVNPASGLRLKDIKAAFVYTGTPPESDSPYASNLVQEGKDYRTNYFSLGCLPDQYFVPVYLTRRPAVYFNFPLGKTYLKVMAIFERVDNPSADDVLFTAKYEVKMTKKGTGKVTGSPADAYFTNLLENNNPLVRMEQDVTLANQTYNLSGETVAASIITVQNASINGTASLVAEEVTLNSNTTINPGMALYGNISDRKGCQDLAPLCPNEVAAFCNSSKYNPQVQ